MLLISGSSKTSKTDCFYIDKRFRVQLFCDLIEYKQKETTVLVINQSEIELIQGYFLLDTMRWKYSSN